ncbi:MAG: hypothetical protein AAF360_12245 [Pseudomonadota bacterium]
MTVETVEDFEAWIEAPGNSAYAAALMSRISLRCVAYGFDDVAIRRQVDRSRGFLPYIAVSAVSWVSSQAPEAVYRGASPVSVFACIVDADVNRHFAGSDRLKLMQPAVERLSTDSFGVGLRIHAGEVLRGASRLAASTGFAHAVEQVAFDIAEAETRPEGAPRDDVAQRILNLPLFHQPDGKLFKNWNRIKALLLDKDDRHGARDEDWGVWIDWYQRRLEGGAWNEDLEIERVLSPDIRWGAPPTKVNAALRVIELHHATKRRPTALRVAVNPDSGNLRQSPARPIPDVAGEIGVADFVRARRDKLLNLFGWHRDQASWQQYSVLDFDFLDIERTLNNDPIRPERIEDACRDAVASIDDLAAGGDLASSMETRRLRRALDDTAKELRRLYPELGDRFDAAHGAAPAEVTTEQREALARAVDLLQGVLEAEFSEDLKEDLAAVRVAEERLPGGDTLGRIDKTARRRLAEYLLRIFQITREAPERLLEKADLGVEKAAKIAAYRRVAEEMATIWMELRDWIMAFVEQR